MNLAEVEDVNIAQVNACCGALGTNMEELGKGKNDRIYHYSIGLFYSCYLFVLGADRDPKFEGDCSMYDRVALCFLSGTKVLAVMEGAWISVENLVFYNNICNRDDRIGFGARFTRNALLPEEFKENIQLDVRSQEGQILQTALKRVEDRLKVASDSAYIWIGDDLRFFDVDENMKNYIYSSFIQALTRQIHMDLSVELYTENMEQVLLEAKRRNLFVDHADYNGDIIVAHSF